MRNKIVEFLKMNLVYGLVGLVSFIIMKRTSWIATGHREVFLALFNGVGVLAVYLGLGAVQVRQSAIQFLTWFTGIFAFWLTVGLIASAIGYAATISTELYRPDNLSSALLLASMAATLQFALLEEIFFRHIILRWSLEKFRLGFAVAIHIILFTSYHFIDEGFTWTKLSSLVVASGLFSIFWIYYRSICASLAIHVAWNFSLDLASGGTDDRMYRGAGLLLGERTITVIVGHQLIFTLIVILTVIAVARFKSRSMSISALANALRAKLLMPANQAAPL